MSSNKGMLAKILHFPPLNSNKHIKKGKPRGEYNAQVLIILSLMLFSYQQHLLFLIFWLLVLIAHNRATV